MFKGATDRDKRVVVVDDNNDKNMNTNTNIKKNNQRVNGCDEYYSLNFNQEVLEGGEKDFLSTGPFLRSLPVIGSPNIINGLSFQSSPSSSSNGSFSNGCWSPDDGSLYSYVPPDESNNNKYQSQSPPGGYHLNGSVDLRNVDERLVDELGLCQNFVRMSVSGEGKKKMKGFGVGPVGYPSLFGLGDNVSSVSGCSGNRNNVGYGCHGGGLLGNGGFGIGNGSFQPSPSPPQAVSFGSSDGGVEFGFGVSDSFGNYFGHDQSNGLCFAGSGSCNSQSGYLVGQRKEHGSDWGGNEGINVLSGRNSVSWPYVNAGFVCSPQCTIDSNGGRGPVDSLGSPFLVQPRLDLIGYNSPLSKVMVLKGKPRGITNDGVLQAVLLRKGAGDLKAFSCEDNLIIQGNGLPHVTNKASDQVKGHRNVSFDEISAQIQQRRSVKFDGCALHGETFENGQSFTSYSSFPDVSSTNSLGEVQGYIYLMAHDQNGCRFLQKIFDEGTSIDVEIIFNELIDHAVELMLKPFGNYVVQKLLDVCNEEQRLQVVQMVTKEPGKLGAICLNTYGTRVVQKLIETLKTRQQITLVVLALKPGFLDLIKDQNGNHVIQRCLQHLSNEDNRFIFDAAAKFCAEIATYQHGCCVMQRCIERSVGKQRDKLIMEICKNGLFLAQDPYGNYVVQFVLDLKSPSVIANLPNVLSQFEGQYVHLSTQKFSSHVVEKCLKNFEESRSQIVRELLSVSHFDQLLQHEFANYVIQTALAVTKGPLHSSLVEAVRPLLNLRTSPYCKRIFSRNLLKK